LKNICIEELCSLLKPKYQYLLDDDAPIDDEDDVLNAPSMSAKNYQNSFPIAKKINPTPNYKVPSNRVTKLASQMLQKNRREVEMNLI